MKTIAGLLFLLGAAAQAGTTLLVSKTPDTEQIHQNLMYISLKILFPCVRENTGTGQSTEEAENICFCDHEDEIRDRLDSIERVLNKHPGWRGRVLEVKGKDSKLKLELGNVSDLKAGISNCGGDEKPKKHAAEDVDEAKAVLAKKEAVVGKSSAKLIPYLLRLGRAYRAKGKKRSAMLTYRRLLKIQDVATPHSWDRVKTLILMGELSRRSGRPAASLRFLKEAQKEAAKSRGGSVKDRIELLDAIGETQVIGKNYKEALKAFRKAHALAKKTWGENATRTLKAEDRVSDALYAKGDFNGALKLQQKLLERLTAKFGKESVKRIAPLRNISMAQLMTGQIGRSEQNLIEALKLGEKAYGKNSIELSPTLMGMSRLYLKMKKPDHGNAVAVLKRNFEITRNYYGEKAEETFRIMAAYADELEKSGDMVKAAKVRRQMSKLQGKEK